MTSEEKSIIYTAKLAGAKTIMIDMFPFNMNDIYFHDEKGHKVFQIEKDGLFEDLEPKKMYNLDEF